MTDLVFVGFTLQTLGEIMIGFTAIMVHHRFLNEHKVDKKVFRAMRREQFSGGLGIILIIVGYIFQVFF